MKLTILCLLWLFSLGCKTQHHFPPAKEGWVMWDSSSRQSLDGCDWTCRSDKSAADSAPAELNLFLGFLSNDFTPDRVWSYGLRASPSEGEFRRLRTTQRFDQSVQKVPGGRHLCSSTKKDPQAPSGAASQRYFEIPDIRPPRPLCLHSAMN
jgi:hypothetical protein